MLYVDGISRATRTWAGSIANLTASIYIAADQFYTRNYLGYISNIRIVQGTAVYTANFTPPTAPLTAVTNTSLLTLQSNRFIDNSTNAFAITKFGDTATKSFGPFTETVPVTGSAYFDGTGDYLTMPASTLFQFGTGAFTIEGWAYATATGDRGIFQQGTSNFPASTSNTVALGINGGGTFQIYAKNTNASSTAIYTVNTWFYFALVRSGTTTVLYINGTAAITLTADTTDYTGTFFGIGAIYGTVGTGFPGFIDELRVTKGYARYTANFTPPTSAFLLE